MELVYIDDYDLRGMDYYWFRSEMYNISHDELKAVGLYNGRVQVDKALIPALKAANEDLGWHGYGLFIKDGYRSPALYKLIWEKRVEQFGREWTDRLVNIREMPHSTGRTVDATLWDTRYDCEVDMREKKDGPAALFVDFYKNRDDARGRRFQKLQELLRDVMFSHGFAYGRLKEYFHFNFVGKARR